MFPTLFVRLAITATLVLAAFPGVVQAQSSPPAKSIHMTSAPMSPLLLRPEIDQTRSGLFFSVVGKQLHVNLNVTFLSPAWYVACDLAYMPSPPRPNHYVPIIFHNTEVNLKKDSPTNPISCNLSMTIAVKRVKRWLRQGRPVRIQASAHVAFFKGTGMSLDYGRTLTPDVLILG